jgi:serine/threonine protein kinase
VKLLLVLFAVQGKRPTDTCPNHNSLTTMDSDSNPSASRWALQELKEVCDDQVDTPELQSLPQVAWEDVEIQHLLGEGGFSSVYQVQVGDRTFALKQLRHKKRSRTYDADEEDWVMAVCDLCSEASLLARLNHENIIQLKGVCNTSVSQSFQRGGPGYFILLEVLQETLQDRMKVWRKENRRSLFRRFRRRHSLGQAEVLSSTSLYQRLEHVAMDVAKGMSYLHDKHILVRDLKPQNIAFDEAGTVKLLDFGMARPVDETDNAELAGTFRYMAPEVLLGSTMGLESDVYSFGIVLYELATLQKPFDSYFKGGKLVRRPAFFDRVVQGGWRPSLTDIPCRATGRLIQKCWDRSPRNRPSFPRIWFLLNKIILSSKSASTSKKETQDNSTPWYMREKATKKYTRSHTEATVETSYTEVSSRSVAEL